MVRRGIELWQRYSHVNLALFDQGMVSGVNFLTGILLARFLGLEEFGRFTLAWLVVEFLGNIQHPIIVHPMTTIGPKQPESDMPTYLGALFVHQIILALVTSLGVLAGVMFASDLAPDWDIEHLAWPLAAAALTYQLQDFLRRYFFLRAKPITAFVNDAVRYLGQFAVLVALIVTVKMDAGLALWVIAGSGAVAVLVGLVSVEPLRWRASAVVSIAVRHWTFSKWLIGNQMVFWLNQRFSTIVASALLSATAAGALRAAQNLIGVTHILILSLENIVPRRAALHLTEGGPRALIHYIKRVALVGELAVAVVAVTAAVIPETLLYLVYGSEYEGFGYVVQWYALVYLIHYPLRALSYGLRAIEQTRPIFLAELLAAVFTIATSYSLVQAFGLSGVLIGQVAIGVISMFALGAAFYHYVWRPAHRPKSGVLGGS